MPDWTSAVTRLNFSEIGVHLMGMVTVRANSTGSGTGSVTFFRRLLHMSVFMKKSAVQRLRPRLKWCTPTYPLAAHQIIINPNSGIWLPVPGRSKAATRYCKSSLHAPVYYVRTSPSAARVAKHWASLHKAGIDLAAPFQVCKSLLTSGAFPETSFAIISSSSFFS